jgi:pimeloyl-ACP methyl ester carboxylesterase
MNSAASHITVVLVHGAWAECASWSRVIPLLEQKGFNVLCAPVPLTSLSDDIAALHRVIARTDGPVVLAAHAYAGAVIAGASDERVKLLVYVAALAPAKGETVAEVFYRDEPHPQAPKLTPDEYGYIWMPKSGFENAFAQDASSETKALLHATQRPIAVACIQEPAPQPAWTRIPTWFLVAERDRMINPKTQHFMADRMQATVRAYPVDHAPLITAPDTVAAVMTEAIHSTFQPARK